MPITTLEIRPHGFDVKADPANGFTFILNWPTGYVAEHEFTMFLDTPGDPTELDIDVVDDVMTTSAGTEIVGGLRTSTRWRLLQEGRKVLSGKLRWSSLPASSPTLAEVSVLVDDSIEVTVEVVNVEVTTTGGEGGAESLDDLTDVQITSPASGDVVRHNGTRFVNTPGTTHYDAAGAATAAQAAAEASAAADATAKVAAEAALARNADNLASGTVADARIPSGIARDSEVTSAIAALAGIYQPLDADLTNLAGVTNVAYGRALLTLANTAALMALLSQATDTAQGIVELATTAEATTGTDIVRAVTPAGLKAHVDTAIAALIGSAPGLLDTLGEISDALGDDPNFAATMTTLLALKAPLASPALTGVPTAPTAAGGTNTTQLATTAYALAAAASAQAAAVQRANHTGTQSADTLTDGTTNKAFLATERTKLAGIETAADVTDAANVSAAGALMKVAGGAAVEDLGAVESNVLVVAATGSTESVDVGVYGASELTMDQNCSISFSGWAPSGKLSVHLMKLSGAFTPSFPAACDGPDGVLPTYASPSWLLFWSLDAGTTIFMASAGKAFA